MGNIRNIRRKQNINITENITVFSMVSHHFWKRCKSDKIRKQKREKYGRKMQEKENICSGSPCKNKNKQFTA